MPLDGYAVRRITVNEPEDLVLKDDVHMQYHFYATACESCIIEHRLFLQNARVT